MAGAGILTRFSKPVRLIVSLCLVGVLGLTDYLIGWEISFSIFYLLPVGLAAWLVGRRAAIFISIASAGTWLAADVWSGATYSSPFIPVWNAVVRLGFFLIVTFLLSKWKAATELLEQKVAERTASLTAEIAERKRIDRALRTLSECNQMLVRATDEMELLRSVCGVLVKLGGYQLAWVGYAEQDEAKTVRPMAHAGYEDGYLDTLRVTWADSDRGRGPVGMAIRTKLPVCTRDVAIDPLFAPWRDEALKRGYKSVLALPLVVDGRTLGALAIFSNAPNPFDAEEMELLIELADDLAYGIQSLRMRAERSRAEQELRRSRADLAEAQHIAHIGNWELDLRSNEVRWSDESYRIFGLEPGSPTPDFEGFLRYVHPEDRARLRNAFDATLQRAEPYRVEYRVVRPDRTERVVQAHAEIRRDQAGQAVGVFGVMLDITERRQAEAQSQRLGRILDASLNEIYVFDAASLRFVMVNHGAQQNLGYTMEELRKLTPLDIKPEFTLPAFESLIAPLREGRVPHIRFETVHRRKNNTLYPVEVRLQIAPHEQPPVFVAIITDITERRQLEAQLFQSQKMEAVGQLAGGVAHDFNNILTTILGYSGLLEERVQSDETTRRHVDEIRKAGERAAMLTQQLLAFSRRQPMQPHVVNINATVAEMTTMLRRLIGEAIELTLVPDKSLGNVRIDPGQLEQVIMNLAVNARDAMSHKGRLTIETANATLDERYAGQHPDVPPGRYVVLAITDTGTGMTDEVKAHLFEPFFTTKELGKGTGLGLATCYGIIKQSGGHIAVYSELGHGTTMRVYLPRVDEPAEVLPARETPGHVRGGTETILVVEDEPAVRELVCLCLRELGYTILEADNGREALALMQKTKTSVQLLVTDVVMPQMGGRELAEKLRVTHPGIKVLYTSGYTENAIVHHGELDPGIAFLQKPFCATTLAHKVREVLDG